MPPLPRLHHIHLPTPIPYLRASALQNTLLHHHHLSRKNPQKHPAPPPTILTFSTTPTYTLGRREILEGEGSVSKAQLEYLASPVYIARTGKWECAEVIKTLRGGQTTFHGPGQLVIYPIFALDANAEKIPLNIPPHTQTIQPLSENPPPSSSLSKTPIKTPQTQTQKPSSTSPKNSLYRIRPKEYIRLLETSTISLLSHYGIKAITTENPGVWIDEEEKIAAVGVHLRRFVVGHGVAVNVNTDLEWFERIVACGLVGKRTVSLEGVLGREGLVEGEGRVPGLEEVAKRWVDGFARGLGFDVEGGAVVRDRGLEDIGLEERMDGDGELGGDEVVVVR